MEDPKPEIRDLRIPDHSLRNRADNRQFEQAVTRILRRSWVQALRELQVEHAAIPQSRELELRDLLILFLKRSWILVITVGIAAWLGHQDASKLPDMYSSTALLVPTATPAAKSGMPGAETSSPDLSLYSALMTSRTVMAQVLKSPVFETPEDTFKVPYAFTIDVDTSDATAMQRAAGQLAGAVRLTDGGDGIIRLAFTSTNAFVAPQMADIIMAATQAELNRVRTSRISSILAQLENRAQEARQKFRSEANKLARFLDANIEMESGVLQMRRSELESEVQMREEAYLLARKRADEARLELDQVYPPAIVYDPASRPASWIGPDRRSKVMLAAFVGFVIGSLLILAWEFLLKKKSPPA